MDGTVEVVTEVRQRHGDLHGPLCKAVASAIVVSGRSTEVLEPENIATYFILYKQDDTETDRLCTTGGIGACLELASRSESRRSPALRSSWLARARCRRAPLVHDTEGTQSLHLVAATAVTYAAPIDMLGLPEEQSYSQLGRSTQRSRTAVKKSISVKNSSGTYLSA